MAHTLESEFKYKAPCAFEFTQGALAYLKLTDKMLLRPSHQGFLDRFLNPL